jgi:hypothetical protein
LARALERPRPLAGAHHAADRFRQPRHGRRKRVLDYGPIEIHVRGGPSRSALPWLVIQITKWRAAISAAPSICSPCKGTPRQQHPGDIFRDANMVDWQNNPTRGDSQTKRGGRDRPGQREAQTMSPDQFRNALIDFTEAVTALALYTQALNNIAATHRSVERKGPTSDGECSLDILEKIARQLHCATNRLRDLYACRGAISHEDADRRTENREHAAKSMPAHSKPRSSSDATSPT